MAEQKDDAELAARFAPVARSLADNEVKIIDELNGAQGSPVDIGGYYHPDEKKTASAMRPSATLNSLIGSV